MLTELLVPNHETSTVVTRLQNPKSHTLTYWFSSKFVPFTLSLQAWESKSIASTHKVRVVRTLELPTLPVGDSVCTFLLEQQKEAYVPDYSVLCVCKALSDTKTQIQKR